MSDVGVKYDGGKTPMEMLPPEALEEIARVMQFGAGKYGRANWTNGLAYSRLISAALRHIMEFQKGVTTDPESNTHHLANAATNLLFLLWQEVHKKEFDDRWIHVVQDKQGDK